MISSISEWEPLVEELSQYAKVILYNRAGCGKSERGTKTRNLNENAKDLHTLIHKLELNDPILIGHSYGGLIVQYFAIHYPNIARSLILVDSTSVDAHLLDEVEIEGGDETSTRAWIQKCKEYATLSKEHLQVEMEGWIETLKKKLPLQTHNEISEHMSNPYMFEILGEELEHDPFYMKELKVQLDGFPDLPTIVIGRDPEVSIKQMLEHEGLEIREAEEIERIWQSLIQEQTNLNSQTEYMLARGSSHDIHKEKPKQILNLACSLLDMTY
ncbi:hypothetical protein N783_18415 [Pontibacillus marinus BH030004 = DSM 16465]|uniref:AB hydrolase-1 domain-containing protein n=2 Tax=Pontibacillus TaxID=289201 RepID=A0A0A5GFN6_9BACI|nr:hypothetical protein N783_18415 [Pontibacillus marinus BH030004 = DSM 16465]